MIASKVSKIDKVIGLKAYVFDLVRKLESLQNLAQQIMKDKEDKLKILQDLEKKLINKHERARKLVNK